MANAIHFEPKSADPFGVSEAFIAKLVATRQGRSSAAGFDYQMAYAIERLATMVGFRPGIDSNGCPALLRYDWAEDIDEVCHDGTIIFTQCKRNAVVTPSSLAQILLGFVPKWLWAKRQFQRRICFRIVSPDTRFSCGDDTPHSLPVQESVRQRFLGILSSPVPKHSDRRLWNKKAETYGHDNLWDSLWGRTSFLYRSAHEAEFDSLAHIYASEQKALDLLARLNKIDTSFRSKALETLRLLVGRHLTSGSGKPKAKRSIRWSPLTFTQADIECALLRCTARVAAGHRLTLVDRTFLYNEKRKDVKAFLARPPFWADVVHGQNKEGRFVERYQTDSLYLEAVNSLVVPMEENTDPRMHSLFVVGPSGSGKSTLVKRVAALLAGEGRLVCVDCGTSAAPPKDDEQRECVERLAQIARVGRPILLILDDPFFGEGWIQLLERLSQVEFAISVIAASSQLLLERYRARIPGVVRIFAVTGATPSERRSLAAFYDRPESRIVGTCVDFLTTVISLASGATFDETIGKLWRTLNNGRPVESDFRLSDLRWEVRAFLIVAFFHRAGVACSESLLQRFLAVTGSEEEGVDTVSVLAQMKMQDGWDIFRISMGERNASLGIGISITSAHQIIAEAAWKLRPLPWLDIEDVLIRLSRETIEWTKLVARLAGHLEEQANPSALHFADRLASSWGEMNEKDCDTRKLYELSSTLTFHGKRLKVVQLCNLLKRKIKPVPDGWLAAEALFQQSLTPVNETLRGYADELLDIVRVADFGIAAGPAIQFADRFDFNGPISAEIRANLTSSMDDRGPTQVNSALFAWLIKRIRTNDLDRLSDDLERWLQRFVNVPSAWVAYLHSICTRLAKYRTLSDGFLNRLEDAVSSWLSAHPDKSVRSKYYVFLLHLPTSLVHCRLNAADSLEAWMARIVLQPSVRVEYLTFLERLRDLRYHLPEARRETRYGIAGYDDDDKDTWESEYAEKYY
jgi:energy-coupling factor transporter ATP-binding protein EcfA2